MVNLTRNPILIYSWTNLIVGRWVGVEIKKGYWNIWFEKTKYERKWILCVREHTMDPTLPRTLA